MNKFSRDYKFWRKTAKFNPVEYCLDNSYLLPPGKPAELNHSFQMPVTFLNPHSSSSSCKYLTWNGHRNSTEGNKLLQCMHGHFSSTTDHTPAKMWLYQQTRKYWSFQESKEQWSGTFVSGRISVANYLYVQVDTDTFGDGYPIKIDSYCCHLTM